MWYRPWFFSKAQLDTVVDMSVRSKAQMEAQRRRQERYREAVAAVMAARGRGGGKEQVKGCADSLPHTISMPAASHTAICLMRSGRIGIWGRAAHAAVSGHPPAPSISSVARFTEG